jgi:kynurenine formamidase
VKRILDLTFKPYPAPVGDGEGVVRPVLAYRPAAPIFHEPVDDSRTVAEVLGYYRISMAMSGVQPGELFQKGMLTTKPWTTYATFHNPSASETWEAQYLAEVPPRDLVGHVTVLDLTGVGTSEVITREHVEAATDGALERRIVFLRTGYSARRPAAPDQRYLAESPTLSIDAARWFVDQGVRVLGADVRTLDPRYAGVGEEAIYETLNRAGVIVVEDLTRLDEVDGDHDFVFIGIPLPVRWVTGGAARVFAVNMDQPTDFIDCSHTLDFFPDSKADQAYPFQLPETTAGLDDLGDYPNPWPGRIEPREDQGKTQRATRLSPFRFITPEGKVFGHDMYLEYGHGTGTHIEGAFFDPWGRHAVPDELLRRYVRIPADRLVAEACLLDLSESVGPLQQIDYTHLQKADPGLRQGDICVLRADITDWYFYGAEPGKTPGLSPDAARWLVDKGIRTLVVDFAVEKSDPMPSSPSIKYTPNKIHYYLHKNDIPIAEWCVNLKHIRKPRFTMAICALPAGHQGGFPAQVFAVEDW